MEAGSLGFARGRLSRRLSLHVFWWFSAFAGEGARATRSVGLAMFASMWQAGGMKKLGSDQAFHDRRHQERKRAEAERKVAQKKVGKAESRVAGAEGVKGEHGG